VEKTSSKAIPPTIGQAFVVAQGRSHAPFIEVPTSGARPRSNLRFEGEESFVAEQQFRTEDRADGALGLKAALCRWDTSGEKTSQKYLKFSASSHLN
jgi:hypothetical protein